MSRRDQEGIERLLEKKPETIVQTTIRACYNCDGHTGSSCEYNLFYEHPLEKKCFWKVAIMHDVEKYETEKATGEPACLTFDYIRTLVDEVKR